MKKKALSSLLLLLVVVAGLVFRALPAHAFTPNLLMDDTVFNHVASMNSGQINTWLNTFPSSCISPNNGFSAPDPTGYSPSGGFTYGGNVSAGQVVYDAAQAYSINPQVLLTTLQKEQSLVTGGSGCSPLAYTGAMGYGCPDGGTTYNYSGVNLYTINGTTVTAVNGTCVNSAAKAGFSEQIIHAAWLLKFGEQRSEGNTAWNVQMTNSPQPGDVWDNSDDPLSCYGGPMTQGSFKRCSTDTSAVFYDGYTTIDGASTHMDTGATASLYWYTPHFNGNQNFDNLFIAWFGGIISSNYFSCHNSSSVPGVPSGGSVIHNQYFQGQLDHLTYIQLNNTGSSCIEAHTWNYGYQSFITDIATNYPDVDPVASQVISADLDGSGQDTLLYIQYMGTGSGKIEISTWKPGYQQWLTNIATNVSDAPTTHGQVIAGDVNGDGKDELMYVQYQGTGSGKVEVHTWNPGLQSFSSDIATNLAQAPPDHGQIITGKVNGLGGPASLMYVQYQGTGSGKVEVHTWNPGYQSFQTDIATNLSEAPPTHGQVISGNVMGDGRDDLMYVQYQNTGSGKVEVHTWKPGYQSFYTDIATNLSQL